MCERSSTFMAAACRRKAMDIRRTGTHPASPSLASIPTAGRHDALVSRPRHGDHAAEYVCRPFGLYLIRDEEEDALDLPKGEYEIPLILYDRSLPQRRPTLLSGLGRSRQTMGVRVLRRSHSGERNAFPFLEVEPRQYRFRLLNASNSRFYYLSLSNRQPFWQIGSDQGLLAEPVALERLTLAPGERADLILDFRRRGQQIVLKSDRYTVLEFRSRDRGRCGKPAHSRHSVRSKKSRAGGRKNTPADLNGRRFGRPDAGDADAAERRTLAAIRSPKIQLSIRSRSGA